MRAIERQYYQGLLVVVVFTGVLLAGLWMGLAADEQELDIEAIRNTLLELNATRVFVDLEGITNGNEVELALSEEKSLEQLYTLYANSSSIALVYSACRMEWSLPSSPREKCSHTKANGTTIVRQIKSRIKGVPKFGKQLVLRVYSDQPPPQAMQQIWRKLDIPEEVVLWSWRKHTRSELEDNKRQLERNPEELARYLGKEVNGQACDYSSKECSQHTIVLSERAIGSYNSEKVSVLHSKDIDQIGAVITLWLEFQFPCRASRKQLWYRLQLVRLLSQYRRELSHIEYVLANQNQFLIDSESAALVSNWSHDCQAIRAAIMGGHFSWSWTARSKQIRLLKDSRTFRANLFPEDYRIGVYLPVSIFVVYPLAILLKSILKFA